METSIHFNGKNYCQIDQFTADLTDDDARIGTLNNELMETDLSQICIYYNINNDLVVKKGETLVYNYEKDHFYIKDK